jgi:CRISPR-associated protein Cas2
MVIFDLPVANKNDMKRASRFRNFLLDEGFWMKQLSVYLKYFDNRDKADASVSRIAKAVPNKGAVTAFYVTDKQFGQARNFYGKVPVNTEEKPQQFVLL